MKHHITLWVLALFMMGITAATVQAQGWSIKADYTESCSCNPTCPCLFGSPPTRGYCEGNNLIEIKEGHYGDVDLGGVSVVTAFSLGKWLKVYVDENASVEQAKAVVELLKLDQTFGIIYSGGSKILSEERVPIAVDKTDTRVTFSVPASKVEIEKMKGLNGNPIRIKNLPVPFMEDHTQYKAVTLTHKSKGKEFKHTGTNGLTSKIDASGTLQ
ncbi:DUF1326 domain-containing protein [Desulfoluna spongiiphila]|uniref:DUF1326 domain-containing protein n=1 Tax=Desulfoluna spongiiphila TaxID=419481 RepID=UPI00125C881C|nr:DUF1326 domain-containing protein [Desulfoluna spongiiphila]VVS92389.1 protein of unknown function duf1326 [Desulfoluna spongiiphila]